LAKSDRTTTSARLRAWAGGNKQAPADEPAPAPGVLVAQLSDGPLAGSTHEVTAIEGRPPKTIDVPSGERTVRYCLAEWEQAGHTAVYGFLYDV
jgi:hypothetical protein